MSQPLKLKPANCERINFRVGIGANEIDLPALTSTLVKAYPKDETVKGLPLFVPVDPSNSETDCHLHLTIEKDSKGQLELELGLYVLDQPSTAQKNFPVVMENISSWLGSSLKTEALAGIAYTNFFYDGPEFRPVIPLPYTSTLPIESAIVKSPTIAGVDVEVGQSDTGLKRFFIYRPTSDKIALSTIFEFAHAANYALFGKLLEKAVTISSVLVHKKEKERV